MNPRRPDLSSKFFGRLFAIENTGKNKHGSSMWWCHCACGNFREVEASRLIQKQVTSCGCLKREKLSVAGYKHGLGHHPAYMTWWHLVDRCTNPESPDYKRYGGRGITVCSDWLGIQNFVAWAEQNGYKKGLEIDRIDNDKGYSPDNCRFANRETQGNNRRSNARFSVHGICKTVAQWSKLVGVDQKMMRYWLINNRLTGWLEAV